MGASYALNDVDGNTDMTLNNASMGSHTSIGGDDPNDISGGERGPAIHGGMPGNGLGRT